MERLDGCFGDVHNSEWHNRCHKKRALLLYQSRPRVREIFKQLTDTGIAEDYEIANAKLQEYFEPQANRCYEVYRFRQATQETNETLDQFHTRTLAQTCEFHGTDFEIEEQIIIGGTSSKIRKRQCETLVLI